ncbi:Uncharacterised protein [Budvicia aquatica]|nr:Uncharacterised protein [Budvicia aquatica]
MNTPAKGNPFSWQLKPTLQRWQAGLRWSMTTPSPNGENKNGRD